MRIKIVALLGNTKQLYINVNRTIIFDIQSNANEKSAPTLPTSLLSVYAMFTVTRAAEGAQHNTKAYCGPPTVDSYQV